MSQSKPLRFLLAALRISAGVPANQSAHEALTGPKPPHA